MGFIRKTSVNKRVRYFQKIILKKNILWGRFFYPSPQCFLVFPLSRTIGL